MSDNLSVSVAAERDGVVTNSSRNKKSYTVERITSVQSIYVTYKW